MPLHVCVCWTLLLPDADIAVKHLQRCHLAPYIKETLSLCETSGSLQLVTLVSSSPGFWYLLEPKHKSAQNVFPSLRETHEQKAEKSGVPNQQNLHEVTLSPKLVPVVVATSLTSQQMGCFLPKLKRPNMWIQPGPQTALIRNTCCIFELWLDYTPLFFHS